MSMFCYQCEQTSKGVGCTSYGTCGKDPEVAALQDIVTYLSKGIAVYLQRARELGSSDRELERTIMNSLILTVTNVNFDREDFLAYIPQLVEKRNVARELYYNAATKSGKDTNEVTENEALFQPKEKLDDLIRQSWDLSIEVRIDKYLADIAGLQELLLYGIKGSSAYAYHALALGYECDEFYSFLTEALDKLTEDRPNLQELLALCLKCGEVNLKVMEMLDKAHTTSFGDPTPTKVRTTPIKGKAILVSGHDLHDLHGLLIATQGKGINVYTHGEMLPAHGYPELHRFSHLVGNYGGAWQDQSREFDLFPGSILMTTNCIQRPLESYKARIFTTGQVGWPGVTHVANGEWDKVIEAALEAPGFTEDQEEHFITVGFGHKAVEQAADQVVSLVKEGHIRHFFLIGGCDGAKTGRDYYTQFADTVPSDTVILTLACGKYRFNKHEFGDIRGIPRLLDIGQCNDAYSAIRIAKLLADAFNTEINKLPLSLVLSWYEQKAVAVLLTLLYLDIKNIRLGPSLPAFLTPNVVKLLNEKYGLQPISSARADIRAILGQ